MFLWHSRNAIDLWNGTFPECYLTASRKNLQMQLIFLLPIVALLISNEFGLKCHTISGGWWISRFNFENRRRRVPGKYTSTWAGTPFNHYLYNHPLNIGIASININTNTVHSPSSKVWSYSFKKGFSYSEIERTQTYLPAPISAIHLWCRIPTAPAYTI